MDMTSRRPVKTVTPPHRGASDAPPPVRLDGPEKRAVDELLIRWALTDLIAERRGLEKPTNG